MERYTGQAAEQYHGFGWRKRSTTRAAGARYRVGARRHVTRRRSSWSCALARGYWTPSVRRIACSAADRSGRRRRGVDRRSARHRGPAAAEQGLRTLNVGARADASRDRTAAARGRQQGARGLQLLRVARPARADSRDQRVLHAADAKTIRPAARHRGAAQARDHQGRSRAHGRADRRPARVLAARPQGTPAGRARHGGPRERACTSGSMRDASSARDASCASGTLPKALGDRSLLEQVWVNLLSNAIKFSSKKDSAGDRGRRDHRRDASTSTSCATTAPDSTRATRASCSACSSACITATSFRAPAWASRSCTASSRGTAGGSGRTRKLGDGATFHFTLPKEQTRGGV